jgi:hypothetical protein
VSLLKPHAVETCMEVKVQPHAFLMLARDGDGGQPHASAALPPGK